MEHTPNTTTNKNCGVPKMRTIKELAAIVKKADPETKLTERAIRTLTSSGELPSVRVGSKFLISLEVFNEFLTGGTTNIVDRCRKCADVKPIKI